MLGDDLETIKYRYKTGQITYEEAKDLACPIINEINKIAKEKAKKYPLVKYRPITFSGVIR